MSPTIETGDKVQTIATHRHPSRPLGEVVEVFTAPGGETIAAVRVGPNPHEVQHYNVTEIETVRAR